MNKVGRTPSLICVTGFSGQVGRALNCRRVGLCPLTQRLEGNREDLILSLEALRPNAIIHAAAFTAVDQAEINSKKADQVNHRAVEHLSRWCRQNKTLLVHFSTDYVFDGIKSSAYLEKDTCNPLNHYGWTKHQSEMKFLEAQPPGCIFRTSWVLGMGKNFVRTILQLGLERSSLSVIDDQMGRPTSAKLLARAALEVVDRDLRFDDNPKLIHLTDSGDPVSWYGLAIYAVNRARDWQYPGITSEQIHPVTSETYGQIVRRPKNSVLNCDRFDRLFDLNRPDWRTTVDDVVEECAQHAW